MTLQSSTAQDVGWVFGISASEPACDQEQLLRAGHFGDVCGSRCSPIAIHAPSGIGSTQGVSTFFV